MPVSVYVHIPFCRVRCAYCDFNTYAGLEDLMPAYVCALVEEIRSVGALAPPAPHTRNGRAWDGGQVHTVYVGGGTPSLLPLPLLDDMFRALRKSFDITPDCEITLEANPGTVDPAYLAGLREFGVNRLSLGVQSAQPHELRLLDRLHTFEQVEECVRWARRAGFDNLSLDLIFALPGQTLPDWRDTLRRTLALGPDHLSLYALSLEQGTPMRNWVHRGLLPMPNPDLAADMYEYADEALAEAGFAQYEISNWARDNYELRIRNSQYTIPPFACRHNLQYWRNLPYLGFGAGAHGCAAGWRYEVVQSPRAYVERMRAGAGPGFPFSPAVASRQRVDARTAMNDTLLLGLRLTREGVSAPAFRARFGSNLPDVFGSELENLHARRLVETSPARVRLTRPARLVANHAFEMFV